MLEPYQPARHQVGSWERRRADAGDSLGKRENGSAAAGGSARSPTEGCWTTKYWRVWPQTGGCTASWRWCAPRVAGCGCSEQGQQQRLLRWTRQEVQKVRRRRTVGGANLTVRTRRQAGCPYKNRGKEMREGYAMHQILRGYFFFLWSIFFFSFCTCRRVEPNQSVGGGRFRENRPVGTL